MENVEPAQVSHRVEDGAIIPIAGGLEVIHTPGHSAGHIALLFKKDKVLIAGDICGNVMGLGYSIIYEDYALGMQSIVKAASYDFEKAVFGHGKPLMQSANTKLKAKFGKKVN
jgi:glyoxylase-like metal-dependent hydrolase (beta-lactamase superfamily II)